MFTLNDSNSQPFVERANRSIFSLVWKLVHQSKIEWDTALPYAILAMNNRINPVTGRSPFQLMFFRDNPLHSTYNSEDFDFDVDERWEHQRFCETEILQDAMRLLNEFRQKAADILNIDLHPSDPFPINSQVFILRPRTHKRDPHYHSPFTVISHSDIRYYLQNAAKKPLKNSYLVRLSVSKQVFPYEALSNMKENGKRIDYIPKEEFYNTLKNKDISDEEYEEYKKAFDILKKDLGEGTTFKDYHDYYLLLDVVLLGQALKNFMNNSYSLSNLNPLAYLSTPAWTFNSLLYTNLKNKEKTIVLPNVDVQKFLCNSIHGGFTMIFNK